MVENQVINQRFINQRIGLKGSTSVEKLNGRVAMAGVLTTVLVELASGKSVMHMFGL